MNTKCSQCEDEVNETFTCERCSQEVCLNCCDNDYPYNETICDECECSFQVMLETWKYGEEPIKWVTIDDKK